MGAFVGGVVLGSILCGLSIATTALLVDPSTPDRAAFVCGAVAGAVLSGCFAAALMITR